MSLRPRRRLPIPSASSAVSAVSPRKTEGLREGVCPRRGAEDPRIHGHAFPVVRVECFVLPVTKVGLSSNRGLDVNASQQE